MAVRRRRIREAAASMTEADRSTSCVGDHAQAMAEIVQAIATQQTLEHLHRAMARALKRVVSFDVVGVVLADLDRRTIKMRVGEGDLPSGWPTRELSLDDAPEGEVLRTGKPLVLHDLAQETRWTEWLNHARSSGARSAVYLPLFSAQRFLGCMVVASKKAGAYAGADLGFLGLVASIVASAVDNALNFEQLTQLKNRLAQEKVYLEEEIRHEGGFAEIVGGSKALQQILEQARTVAPTDAAVLVLGETGTGKELMARAIHDMSGRKDRAFVKMNCAAIPTGLLESELFGHEKGAFTGAVSQRIGRYELADQGTLFLDEVGDISSELQPKLLRVLQEQEFERLGSAKTLKVNVRLVAATNVDLERMVQDKKFRSDLYYRLNVFPVRIPPLRERRDDIPVLVRHFVQRCSKKLRKEIASIPTEVMEALTRAPWPGNIRELEHFIERAVILSKGTALSIPAGELGAQEPPPTPTTKTTSVLHEGEREAILRALREAKWVVSGPDGAAAKLGLKRTTLQYKMRKFDLLNPQ
jgi:formate hydrogenlyase transcriptional activator